MIKRLASLVSIVALAFVVAMVQFGTGTVPEAQAANPTPTKTSTAVPGADFSASPLAGPAPLTVQFTALNRSILMSCSWKFGDGTSQSFTPPPGSNMYYCPSTTHTYTVNGSYSVTLIVTKVTGRGNSMTKANYIQVGPISTTATPTYTPTFTPSFTPTGSLPDLIVASISWSPSSPQLGSTVLFSAAVQNIGSAPTPDGVIQDVCFTITSGLTSPRTICSTSRTASIPAGGTVTLQADQSWTITVDTNYSVQATADYGGRITESNENNNSLTKALNSKSTPTSTFPPSATPSWTPTRTPTPTATGNPPCNPATAIAVPFPFDGAGTFCWQISSLSYINSWNLATLTVNGVDFTNKYAPASSLPAKINGYWYIYYVGSYSWSHFEAK